MRHPRRNLLKASAGAVVGTAFHVGNSAHADSFLKVDSQFDGSIQKVPRWENTLPVPSAAEPLSTGQAPFYQNSFKQDVTMLGPNSAIVIRMRFRTFLGPFMFHCHTNEHEDVEMMFQFEVAETGSRRSLPVQRFFA